MVTFDRTRLTVCNNACVREPAGQYFPQSFTQFIGGGYDERVPFFKMASTRIKRVTDCLQRMSAFVRWTKPPPKIHKTLLQSVLSSGRKTNQIAWFVYRLRHRAHWAFLQHQMSIRSAKRKRAYGRSTWL